MSKKILIIGTGAYGTSIAHLLSKNMNNEIIMLGVDSKEVNEINTLHTNSKYFPGKTLDSKIKATNNMDKALEGVQYIFVVTPSDVVLKVINQIVNKINHSVTWINLAKGFDYNDHKLIAVAMQREIPSHLNHGICKIAGPTFASEIIDNVPSALTVGCTTIQTSEDVRELFKVKNIIIEITDDIIGVEFASVIKNSLAIFMGIINGLNLQDNGMAMFLTLAIKEMVLFKKQYPSIQDKTLLGFAGLGDLFLTGSSSKSRNFSTGFEIGETNNVNKEKWENTTIEGIRSIDILVEFATKNKIKLILLPTLKAIFDKKDKPSKLIEDLIQHIDDIDLTN